MTDNNPKLDVISINAYTKFVEILSIGSQDIELKGKSDIKGHNSVTNLRKMALNNPKVDLVSINAYTKRFDEILSIGSKDIEQKRKSDINQGP